MSRDGGRLTGPRALSAEPAEPTTGLGIPRGVWNWRGTALVLVMVAAPQLITMALSSQARDLADAASLSGLVTFPVVLGAAVLIYFHWRIAGGTKTSWLACGLTAIAVQGISLEGLRLANDDAIQSRPGWMLLVDLAFALLVLGMVTMADRIELPYDPVAVGLTVGLLVTAARYGLAVEGEPLDMGAEGLVAGALILFAINLLVAHAVFHLSGVPAWARVRLALAVILLSVNHLMSYATSFESLRAVTAMTADLVGAVLLCSMAMALLRLSIGDSTRAVDDLSDRVQEVEATVRADRERLHEITGTVAGIASASRLIHQGSDISANRRSHLQRMLACEIGRLERLVGERPTELSEVDLDGAIWPLVTAHRARGHKVQWEPNGLLAAGRADDVAEVVNILLSNAATHAPQATARIEVREVDGSVEIAVSDSGPGVSRAVSANLFEWGARGPASPGQGIGLNVARRLMSEQHGYLEVVTRPRGGSTFVVGLPAVGEDHDAAHSAAQ